MGLGTEGRAEEGSLQGTSSLRVKSYGDEQGPKVMVAGESFPVCGLRSMTSLFNVGLRRD